jgi:hypothetical protein
MKTTVTTKTYLLTLTLVTFAQAFALLMFSSIVLFLSNDGRLSGEAGLQTLFLKIVPALAIVSLLAGYFIFKKMIIFPPSKSFKEKLTRYQQAILVRSAFLELTGFSGAVAAFLTGELYFLSAPLLAILLFYFLRPTVFSMVDDLGLSSGEKALLEDPGSVLYESDK